MFQKQKVSQSFWSHLSHNFELFSLVWLKDFQVTLRLTRLHPTVIIRPQYLCHFVLQWYKRSSVNTVVMTNSGCLNEGRSLAIIFPPSAACCALLSGAVWSFRSCIFIFFLTRSLSYWTLSGFTSAGEATMPDNIKMIASVNILGKVGEGTSFLLTHRVSQLITTSSERNRSHPKPSMMWC